MGRRAPDRIGAEQTRGCTVTLHRFITALAMMLTLLSACAGDDDAASTQPKPEPLPRSPAPLVHLAPVLDAALVIELDAVRSTWGEQAVSGLLEAADADPAVAHVVEQIATRSLGVDLAAQADRIALVHRTTGSDRYALVVDAPADPLVSLRELGLVERPGAEGAGGLFDDPDTSLVVGVFPGGAWAVGDEETVRALLDRAAMPPDEEASALDPGVGVLQGSAPLRWVAALPAREREASPDGNEPAASIADAEAVSGTFEVKAQGHIGEGELRWHMSSAAAFAQAPTATVRATAPPAPSASRAPHAPTAATARATTASMATAPASATPARSVPAARRALTAAPAPAEMAPTATARARVSKGRSALRALRARTAVLARATTETPATVPASAPRAIAAPARPSASTSTSAPRPRSARRRRPARTCPATTPAPAPRARSATASPASCPPRAKMAASCCA